MTVILGLDIGTNSVGSAWVDTRRRFIKFGVSVFPAGVEESDEKRGAPKNQARRQTRSQRRSIGRGARRKHHLRKVLTRSGLLPQDPHKLSELFRLNPWTLRCEALCQPLTPHEFGRILVHLNQRRGAFGIEVDSTDEEAGKVKDAINHTQNQLHGRTFGQMMAEKMKERRRRAENDRAGTKETEVYYCEPVRNRRDSFEFHADRAVIWEEFDRIWRAQESFGGELAPFLTEELRRLLDDPVGDVTWRYKGHIFGQRRTYWRTGTLGRCDLEPTDLRCPIADMYAQEFRVLETVNNIRIRTRNSDWEKLDEEQTARVTAMLLREESATSARVRRELGIDKRSLKKKNLPQDYYELNLEADPDRSINTNWFYREIVLGVFGEETWETLPQDQRDSVNRAILKFDPECSDAAEKLLQGAQSWWGLPREDAHKLITAWQSRPKLEKRINLSRRALLNLLPYIRQGMTVTEARQAFAENDATPQQKGRYALRGVALNKRSRYFLKKHPNLLPPAPTMSNPVVRKAVHEVRRHLNAYIRHFGRVPDRVVVELARSARQSAKVRDAQLSQNRRREKLRNAIRDQFGLHGLRMNQQEQAIDRVLLCRQQKTVCPYSNETITEQMAADGTHVEVDHIIPRSRSNNNGLNNRVICFRHANRDKGNQTPKEWLGADSEEFAALQQRLRHLSDKSWSSDYFRPKDCRRKWENLLCDAPSTDEFLNSQLSDTAYASTQVAAYLRDALYSGEQDGRRHVFTTKGAYTAVLRRDWGLLESELDRQWRRTVANAGQSGDRGIAKREQKDRRDHLHHAIDALVAAFSTGTTIERVADAARLQEELKGKLGYWTSRQPIDPPWGTQQEFRDEVLQAVGHIVVSHRPARRKLVGYLHKENQFGPVLDSERHFTRRIGVFRSNQEHLKPKHLRVPEGWDELSIRLEDPSLSKSAKKAIGRQLAAMQDCPPGKSGIVRDRNLRDQLRKCLRRHGLDPDGFTQKQIKELVEKGLVRLTTGVPVKRVVLLRTLSDPVRIHRKFWDPEAEKMVPDKEPESFSRTQRVYESQSNHHIEILEDVETGRWTGRVVRTFDAAARVRPQKGDDDSRPESKPAVDRSDRDGKRFIMSLSEGEMICARRNDRGANAPDAVGYFVVAKLDSTNRIHFAPHWDARRAAEQDRWRGGVTPANLKDCQPEDGVPPYKVRVSPLGDVRRIDD